MLVTPIVFCFCYFISWRFDRISQERDKYKNQCDTIQEIFNKYKKENNTWLDSFGILISEHNCNCDSIQKAFDNYKKKNSDMLDAVSGKISTINSGNDAIKDKLKEIEIDAKKLDSQSNNE